jgi:hypothetical protein
MSRKASVIDDDALESEGEEELEQQEEPADEGAYLLSHATVLRQELQHRCCTYPPAVCCAKEHSTEHFVQVVRPA